MPQKKVYELHSTRRFGHGLKFFCYYVVFFIWTNPAFAWFGN